MYYLIIFLILMTSIYFLILSIKGERIFFNKEKTVLFISKYIEELNKRNIIIKTSKWITPINVSIFSIFLFIVSFILLNFVLGVISTSIILSIPVLVSPIIISKILIRKNKQKILNCLPMYAINLKNYITEENNIVAAMMKANAEQPLDFFVNTFKKNVSKGINVIQALDVLEREVGVKKFSDLVTGIKSCYINGGNFVTVLEKYIAIITKEITHVEETEEKAFSSVLTLIVMCVLNALVVFFMLNNGEYANIIRNTFVGKLILNINAISYMVIAGLVSNIYREE